MIEFQVRQEKTSALSGRQKPTHFIHVSAHQSMQLKDLNRFSEIRQF